MLVNKRQDNKLEKVLHLVGDLFELYNDVRTYKLAIFANITSCVPLRTQNTLQLNKYTQSDRPTEKERAVPAFLSHQSAVLSTLAVCCDSNHSHICPPLPLQSRNITFLLRFNGFCFVLATEGIYFEAGADILNGTQLKSVILWV
jgi:hypothetical protein